MNSKAIRSYRAKASADLQSRIAGKYRSRTSTVSEADEIYSYGCR